MVEEILGRLKEVGYATIPDAIDATQVAWARAELEAQLAQTPTGRDGFEGFRTRRIYGLFGKTRSLDSLALHPTILGVLDGVLGHYQLSAPTGIAIGPGEHAQPLHPDDAIYPIPRPHPEVVVNVMWPLQDFTVDNGGTRIVPGSHRWIDERPDEGTPTVTVEIPAGSALIYAGSVWHGGGPTAPTRTALESCSTTRHRGSGQLRIMYSSSHRRWRPRSRHVCRSFSATTSIPRLLATSTGATRRNCSTRRPSRSNVREASFAQLPAIPTPFARSEGESSDPEQCEDDCNDPEGVNGKSKAAEQQRQK
jgi:Phytanoyl-CoA dioxygenase (PhyH)